MRTIKRSELEDHLDVEVTALDLLVTALRLTPTVGSAYEDAVGGIQEVAEDIKNYIDSIFEVEE